MRSFVLALAGGLLLTAAPANAQYPADSGALVRSWYAQLFNRRPDPSGWQLWVTALNQGASPKVLLAQILATPEYFGKSGSSTEGFVATMFQDVLGRQPTPQELNYWSWQAAQSGRAAAAYGVLSRYPQAQRMFEPPAPPPSMYAPWQSNYRR